MLSSIFMFVLPPAIASDAKASQQCTDFSGEYVVPAKPCYFSNQIRPALVFGLRESSTLTITQEGCERMRLHFIDSENNERTLEVDLHPHRVVEREKLTWHIQKVKNRRLFRSFILNETYIGGIPPIAWFLSGSSAKIKKTLRGNLILKFADPHGALMIGPIPVMGAIGHEAKCRLRNKANAG